jgi:hypothetical protein
MPSFTDGKEKQLLDHILKVATNTPSAQLWIGLGTSASDPIDDGTLFTEPVGNGYARKQLNPGDANWQGNGWGGGTTARRAANKSLVVFNTASPGGWGLIKWWGVFEASSGGVPIGWGPVNESQGGRLVTALDTPFFAAKAMTIDILPSGPNGGFHNYLADGVLSHVFQNDQFPTPSSLFIAVARTGVTLTDSMTYDSLVTNEQGITGANYARQEHNDWRPTTSGPGESDNIGDIVFGPPPVGSGGWGAIVGSCIVDNGVVALGGPNPGVPGRILTWAVCTPQITVNESETLKYLDGNYNISLG